MALLTAEKRSADIASSIESRDGGMTLKEFSTWLLASENAEVLNKMTAVVAKRRLKNELFEGNDIFHDLYFQYLVRSFENDYSKLSNN
jgi:hypothetical protein